MEPVVFGKKRALRVQAPMRSTSRSGSFRNNRHAEIIEKLREFTTVKMWEQKVESWSYETFQKLKQTPYLIRTVPEKRNKKGYLNDCPNYFFLLTTIRNKRICCFIEKKKPLNEAIVYQTRFRFKDELFEGTLFTGSLVMSEDKRNPEREEITDFFSHVFSSIKCEVSAPAKKNNWLFIINDLWIHSGKEVSSMLPQRIVQIQDLIGKDWYPDSKLDTCDFNVTNYRNYISIEDFLKNQRKFFPYGISDHKVVFTCTKGIPGVDEYAVSLKNKIPKPLVSETISFKNGEWNVQNIQPMADNEEKDQETKELFLKMSDYPDVYWVFNPKNWNKLGAAMVKSLDESKCLKELFKKLENSQVDYLKLTCQWIPEFEKWQPMLEKYLK